MFEYQLTDENSKIWNVIIDRFFEGNESLCYIQYNNLLRNKARLFIFSNLRTK
jgi:hypothetical protein